MGKWGHLMLRLLHITSTYVIKISIVSFRRLLQTYMVILMMISLDRVLSPFLTDI